MPTFNVANLSFSFEKEMEILSQRQNYLPFRTEKTVPSQEFLFTIGVDKGISLPQEKINFSYTNEIGCYGVTCENQTYKWVLKDTHSEILYVMVLDVALKKAWINFEITNTFTLQAADDFVRFAFIYTAAFHHTVLLHASCIKNKDRGIAFMGRSGIGKSTHSRLWLNYIQNSELLNDDQPAVRIQNDEATIYGTPWSGKTTCYKNKSVKLNAILCMDQKTFNKLIPIPKITLFAHLLSACSLIKTEKVTLSKITETLSEIVNRVSGGILQNKPEEEAALLSYEFMLKHAQ